MALRESVRQPPQVDNPLVLMAISAGADGAARQKFLPSVPGMAYAAGPITVKKVVTRADGVTNDEVDYAKRESRSLLDAGITSIGNVTSAPADAGYSFNVNH